MRAVVEVKQGGRVIIPAAIRKKLGLHPGSRIVFELDRDEMRVKTIADSIRLARSLCAPYLRGRKDIVDGFLAERRKAAARE